MTTGSKTVDARYVAYPGNIKVGLYETRVWNGGDSVSARIPKEYVYCKVPSRDRNGNAIFLDHWYVVKKKRLKRPPTSPEEQHPYTCTRIVREDGCHTWKSYRLSDGVFVSQGWRNHAILVGNSTWTANDDLALIAKLREQIVGSDFDLGVFFAELPQTVAMIGDAALRVDRMYRAMRKLDYVGMLDALGVAKKKRRAVPEWTPSTGAAQMLLETRYGWQPLLSDVYEGAQALANYYGGSKAKKYRAVRTVVDPTTVPNGQETLAPTFKINGRKCNKFTRKGIIAILREEDVPTPLELVDPLTMAWERLPWSFVADWFIPIGSYLSARGIASSLKGTFVVTKTTHHKQGSSTPVLISDGTYSYEWVTLRDASYYQMSMEREVLVSLPVPMPVVKPLGKIATWIHAENSVALAISVNQGREAWTDYATRPLTASERKTPPPFYDWGFSKRR